RKLAPAHRPRHEVQGAVGAVERRSRNAGAEIHNERFGELYGTETLLDPEPSDLLDPEPHARDAKGRDREQRVHLLGEGAESVLGLRADLRQRAVVGRGGDPPVQLDAQRLLTDPPHRKEGPYREIDPDL